LSNSVEIQSNELEIARQTILELQAEKLELQKKIEHIETLSNKNQYLYNTVSNYLSNISWKDVAIGIGVTAGIAIAGYWFLQSGNIINVHSINAGLSALDSSSLSATAPELIKENTIFTNDFSNLEIRVTETKGSSDDAEENEIMIGYKDSPNIPFIPIFKFFWDLGQAAKIAYDIYLRIEPKNKILYKKLKTLNETLNYKKK